MEKSEKFMLIIVILVLLANCAYLNYRVDELESRVLTIENNQAFIVKNMNEAVNIASELVMRIVE